MKKVRENSQKGFSLIELIIVIAIMAVLVAVLAPQFLKYVERARNATDIANATEIVEALQVYATDPDADLPGNTGELGAVSIEVGHDGNSRINCSSFEGHEKIIRFVVEALDSASIPYIKSGEDYYVRSKCVSRQSWSAYTISFYTRDGNIIFKYSAGIDADDLRYGTSEHDNVVKKATAKFKAMMTGSLSKEESD